MSIGRPLDVSASALATKMARTVLRASARSIFLIIGTNHIKVQLGAQAQVKYMGYLGHSLVKVRHGVLTF